MLPGDYFVTATGGVVARLIRWATRSPVNHAGVYIGGGLTVEAQPKGAKVGKISQYPRAVSSSFPLSHIDRWNIETAAKAFIGTPYNFADIAAQALVRVFGWHAPKWALERLSSTSRLQCAQLVDVAYQKAGIHLFATKVPGLVAPSDLLDLIREAKHG